MNFDTGLQPCRGRRTARCGTSRNSESEPAQAAGDCAERPACAAAIAAAPRLSQTTPDCASGPPRGGGRRSSYFGLPAAPPSAPPGSSSLTPATVSVTDEGGSPSERSQPRPTASRIAASTASVLSVPSLRWTLSTCVQVGGGRRPVSSRTAVKREDRNCAGLVGGLAIVPTIGWRAFLG